MAFWFAQGSADASQRLEAYCWWGYFHRDGFGWDPEEGMGIVCGWRW